jgi:dTMP kinase
MAFISFEGIEGCGKSTQARSLGASLRGLGHPVVLTQEPGGTEIGLRIRELVLGERGHGLSPVAELLLFFADRAQHVAQRVRPALAEGSVVISDRYADSSRAYQGIGRGLDPQGLEAALLLATGGLTPDLTLLIDVPVEVGLGRVRARGRSDRLESEALAFHERVRQGYLVLAAREPGRFLVLDGRRPEAELAEAILAASLACLSGAPRVR